MRLFVEEFEVDGVAHGFVASVGWVEVVTGVGCGREDSGVGGVLGGFVEVDEAIELGGGADPLVDGLAHGFSCWGGVFGADVGGEGGCVDLDAVGVGASGELAEADDEVFRGDDIVGLDGVLCVADVVDAFEQDEVFDASLGDDVAVEASKGAGAGGVVQDAVAADALVEDGEVGGVLVGLEAAGEDVGPAGVGVAGAVGAVGDAVSEGDDGGAVVGGFDVEAFEDGPGVDLFGVVELGGADDVAGSGVAGLVREAMDGELAEGLLGQVEADGHVGEGGKLEVDGIADDEGSGRDGDGGTSAEAEGVGGGQGDVAVACAEGDVGLADGEGIEAELVGEDDAYDGAAEGDVDDLAEGGVAGEELAFGVGCGHGRGGPGADPVVWLGGGRGGQAEGAEAEQEQRNGCECAEVLPNAMARGHGASLHGFSFAVHLTGVFIGW